MGTIILVAAFLLATLLKPTYTIEEIRAEYDKIVKFGTNTYGSLSFLEFKIDTSAPSVVLPFFTDNYVMADYFRIHYHQVVYEYHKRMKLEGAYQDLLKDSVRFADIIFESYLPLISGYLREHGSTIEGEEPRIKTQITLDRLTGNAVKFFFPDSIYTDGRIQSRVCVAVNGFSGPRQQRNLTLEAFCWSVIEPYLTTEERTPLEKEFDKAYALGQDLQLSPDVPTRLKRFQGVVWGYLSQSKVLRELLLNDHEKKKQLLTFTLKSG
jgi:hypothetical protein